MGQIANWWAKRNEIDPRLIAYQQQILEVSRIRQMMAREQLINPGRTTPIPQQEDGRPHVSRPLDRDTGLER